MSFSISNGTLKINTSGKRYNSSLYRSSESAPVFKTTSYYSRDEIIKNLATGFQAQYQNDVDKLGKAIGLTDYQWNFIQFAADKAGNKDGHSSWDEIATLLVENALVENAIKDKDFAIISKNDFATLAKKAKETYINRCDDIKYHYFVDNNYGAYLLDVNGYTNRTTLKFEEAIVDENEDDFAVTILAAKIEQRGGVDTVMKDVMYIDNDQIKPFKDGYQKKHNKVFDAKELAWFLWTRQETKQNPTSPDDDQNLIVYSRSYSVDEDILRYAILGGYDPDAVKPEATTEDGEAAEESSDEEVTYTQAESSYTNGAETYTVPEGRGLTFIANDLVEKDQDRMKTLLNMPNATDTELRAALKDKMKAHIDANYATVGAKQGNIYYFYKEATLDLNTVFDSE